MPRHPEPPRDPARSRARPFRCGAGQKARPRREVRLGSGSRAPASASGSRRRRSRTIRAWARRRRRDGRRAATRPARLRLWRRGDHHLRHRAREGGRSLSAPFSPRRASTAAPTDRRARRSRACLPRAPAPVAREELASVLSRKPDPARWGRNEKRRPLAETPSIGFNRAFRPSWSRRNPCPRRCSAALASRCRPPAPGPCAS